MPPVVYIPILCLYGWLTVVHLLPSWAGERGQQTSRAVTIGTALLHFVVLAWDLLTVGHPVGFHEGLSATALGVVAAYAIVGVGRVRALGMLVAPLALVLVGTSLAVPPRGVVALEQTGYSAWLPVHLFLVFSGIAGFGLSGAVGVTYLWARDRLKKKRFQDIRRLPSLEVLDRIQFRAMLFGFVFLTLGIGAGGAWAAASLHGGWTMDPKILVTVLIWAWYGVGLQLRLLGGQRGRWTSLFSIVGFFGLMISLVGVNLLISGWHGYDP